MSGDYFRTLHPKHLNLQYQVGLAILDWKIIMILKKKNTTTWTGKKKTTRVLITSFEYLLILCLCLFNFFISLFWFLGALVIWLPYQKESLVVQFRCLKIGDMAIVIQFIPCKYRRLRFGSISLLIVGINLIYCRLMYKLCRNSFCPIFYRLHFFFTILILIIFFSFFAATYCYIQCSKKE